MNEQTLSEMLKIVHNAEQCPLDDVYLEILLSHLRIVFRSERDTDSIIMGISDEYPVYERYLVWLRTILEEKGMSNLEISGSKNICIFIDHIVDEIVFRIRTQISHFSSNSLLTSLHMLAGFMIQFHLRARAVLYGELKMSQIEKLTLYERVVLQGCEQYRKELRTDLDGVFGMDKSIIQFLVAATMVTTNLESHHYIFSELDFRRLYDMSYAAVNLIAVREAVTAIMSDSKQLSVRDGVIVFPEALRIQIETYRNALIDDRVSNLYIDTPSIINKLKANFRKVFHFPFDAMIDMVGLESEVQSDDRSVCYPLFKSQLIELLVKHTECSFSEAESLVSFMTLQPITIDSLKSQSVEQYKYRLLLKPLLTLDFDDESIYLLSIPLISFAFGLMQMKLTYDLIPECNKLNSKLIQDHIKKDLERRVSNVLKRYFPIVWPDVPKNLSLMNKDVYVKLDLPGQIDNLAYIKGRLFVVECKDVHLSFGPNGYRQDLKKTARFITNINQKVSYIKEHRGIFEEYFSVEIVDFVPVIVFQSPNISIHASIDRQGVTLLHESEFEAYILGELGLTFDKRSADNTGRH